MKNEGGPFFCLKVGKKGARILMEPYTQGLDMENLHQINVDSVKEGMCFSSPLFFDDGENMFLPKGHAVSLYHLNVLKRWKVPFLLTSGHVVTSDETGSSTFDQVSFGNLDEVEELDDADEVEELEDLEELEELEEPDELHDAGDSSSQKKNPDLFLKKYQNEVNLLSDIFTRYKTKAPIDRSEINFLADELIDIVEQEQTMAMAHIMNRGKSDSLASSAINIAIISATVAFHLQIPRQRVVFLVSAALLHDIGMMQISEAIVNKQNVLTSQEYEQLKLHSMYSARFVTDVLMLPREVSNIVLQHHERWDGSGYPNGRKGEEIDLGARILAVADTFEALVGKKSYHDAIISYEAMKTLLAESGTHFDSDVTKAFVQTMGVYPVGSIIQLSDNSVAKVIQANPEAPFLPAVQLQGEDGAIIKLAQQKALYIVRVVAPK